MNAKQLAEKLHGTEYPIRMSKTLIEEIRLAGLLVVFGASDDLMEFRGSINDEVGVYNGGTALLYKDGVLGSRDDIDEDEELELWFKNKAIAKPIEAIFDQGEYSWQYKTDIPHETFDVVEDEEKYCKGLVISVSDL